MAATREPDADGRRFGANNRTDSAGQPWAGRSLHHHDNPYANDDGTTPAIYAEAVAAFRAGTAGLEAVAAAVMQSRLLIPLIAEAGDLGVTPEGRTVDKTQELSIVTVQGPDGRTVLPAFTSADAMSAWDPKARPIPADGRRVALAAADDGATAIVLNPGTPEVLGLRRPAIWAIAQGQDWTPADRDPDVLAEFAALAADEPVITRVALHAGDPRATLETPEVVVTLGLVPGLSQDDVQDLVARQAKAWSASDLITDRVDSLTIRLEAVDLA